jgi:hypothetical protein
VANEHNSLLIPPKDPIAIAEAAINLLIDKDLSGRLAENGPSSVSDFDIKNFTTGVLGVYKRLLGKKGVL